MTGLRPTPSVRGALVRTDQRWRGLTTDRHRNPDNQMAELVAERAWSLKSSHGHSHALTTDRRSWRHHGTRPDTMRPARA